VIFPIHSNNLLLAAWIAAAGTPCAASGCRPAAPAAAEMRREQLFFAAPGPPTTLVVAVLQWTRTGPGRRGAEVEAKIFSADGRWRSPVWEQMVLDSWKGYSLRSSDVRC
jgi:hypothetical protein